MLFEDPELRDKSMHFILVLDGMDKQRDPPPTLMPALARLCETVSLNSFLLLQDRYKQLLNGNR